jgi:hypothetical protein
MHAVPDKILDKHLGILGINGSGKTYTAKGCVETLLEKQERVCIIDPTGVWWGLKSSATGKSGGFPVVVFGGEHADLPISGMHGEAIAEAIGTSNTPAIIDTSLMRGSERTKFFTDFAETLRIKNSGPLHLFIDEAHLFCPQGRVSDPNSAQLLHAANNLISLGRARGLRVTLISQRPAKMHKDSLTQVHSLIAMRLIAPHDRVAVENWIADQADVKRGKEIIASLPSLKTGEGYLWAPEHGILEKIKFPKISTFDSSATPDGDGKQAGPVLRPIDLSSIETRLSSIKTEAVKNDPSALKRRIAELEKQLREKQPATVDPHAIEKARAEGFRDGVKAISDELRGRVKIAKQAIDGIMNVNVQAPKIETVKITPKAKLISTFKPVLHSNDAGGLPAPQRCILRSLHFWRSVGHENPTREQVAGVAGYAPGSGNFNNIVGNLKTAGLIGSNGQGTLCLVSASAEYEMSGEEARDMLLSIMDNPQKKIVSSFNGDESLSRDEVAERSGYAAGSGNFNNIVGRLSTLNVLERPAQGMLKISEWAKEVLV